jgi:hypothetical protein
MKRIILAIVLLIGVAAFACNGGDDGSGTPTSAPPTSPSAATGTPRPTGTTAATTATPTIAATAAPATGEIAYVLEAEGNIWLVNADGSGAHKITDGQCRQSAGPFWSRRGDKIACVSGGTNEAPQTKIFVFDLEGRTLAQVEHQAWLSGFAWSADDRHFFYGISEGDTLETARPSLIIGDTESEETVRLDDAFDPRWSPDGTRLAYMKAPGDEPAIYDLASAQTTSLPAGRRLLAWVLGGDALLVATNYQEQEFGADYEANLMNIASAAMTRVPELDNSTQFWLSRDGRTAAFLAGPAERPEGGITISILDLATRQVTPVEGAVIGYPSERIPADHIAFSPDGAYLLWVDVVALEGQRLAGTIYRSRLDGSELTQLAALNAVLFTFSPDRSRVLYFDGAAVRTAAIDGANAQTLVESADLGSPPAAWRPLP